ncbi:hypothetical protein DWB68_04445 [Galactobacter valiniphilus]|uniref:Uncharacterized protein n=1 Tax=Galactobacter valiniphilus TaxID=2676122 RepID=A0A399JBU1_9MICC|nr:hypothetical protein DWB68_04445 [Galactobacter valiniphilus]
MVHLPAVSQALGRLPWLAPPCLRLRRLRARLLMVDSSLVRRSSRRRDAATLLTHPLTRVSARSHATARRPGPR